LIAPYKGEINEAFREMPSDVAFGASLFFWRLEIDLLTYTLKSLDKKTLDRMKTNFTSPTWRSLKGKLLIKNDE
jgi:hypothetical protein